MKTKEIMEAFAYFESRLDDVELEMAYQENDIIDLTADLDDAYNEVSELRQRVAELEDMENYIIQDLDYLYDNE